MSPTFRALEVRNYRLYAGGSLISNTGTWMMRVAQDWLVLALTGSGAALGITTGLQFLPYLIFTPVAGLIADRMSKRRLLALTQVGLGVTSGLLGLLAISGHLALWHVYVLTFLFGVGTAFDAPARQSFVSEMVGRDMVANAVGLNSATFNLGRIVGPSVAGLMIAALGSGVLATGWVILINAVSYGAVIFSLVRMDATQLHLHAPVARAQGAMRDAVTYVLARPELVFAFVVAFAAGTFGLNFQMTNALMAKETFGKGAGEYGLLGSAMAVGSLSGALLAARRGTPRRLVLPLSSAAFGASVVAAGLMPTYVTFAVWLPVVGVTALTMLNTLQTTVQLTVDEDIRGRVVGLYMMVLMGGTPLGAPVVGWLAEQWGARWSLVGGGGLTLLVVLAASAWLVRHEHIDVRAVRLRRRQPEAAAC